MGEGTDELGSLTWAAEAGLEKGIPYLLWGPKDQLARCVAVPVIGLPFQ
jgi:hypothetical protein